MEELHGGGSSAQIQLGGGNLTINLPPSINGNFAGKITGTGSFIKTGYGSSILYLIQHMIIQEQQPLIAGAIKIIASSVLPDGTVVTLLQNGSLKLWGDYTQTLAGLISSASTTRVHMKTVGFKFNH